MLAKLTFLVGVVFTCLNLVGQNGTVTYAAVPDGPSPCVGGNRSNGINPRGDIVGRCMDGAGNPRSLLMTAGSTAPVLIDFSGAPFTPTLGSTTRAINARGDIVGRYFDAAGVTHGYLLSGGAFTEIQVSLTGAIDTDARGINNPGTIVGSYDVLTSLNNVGTVPLPHGFMRDATGNFTALNFPGAVATTAEGINDAGDVVGGYVVITNPATTPPAIAVHAYVLHGGVYTSFDVPLPGATGAIAFGINEQGEITGSYTTQTVTLALLGDHLVNSHGFVRSTDGSTFTPIDFPDAISTDCRGGFNPRGNIVGAFVDSFGAEHGFVASTR
jgi:uncharacterized membrane protein